MGGASCSISRGLDSDRLEPSPRRDAGPAWIERSAPPSTAAGGMWRALLLVAAVSRADASEAGIKLKFEVTGIRNCVADNADQCDVALSELKLYDAQYNEIDIVSVSTPAWFPAHSYTNQLPANLADGLTTTAWLDTEFGRNGQESFVVVELPSGVEPRAFEIFTAPGTANRPHGWDRRDPTEFAVYKENVCGGWDIAVKTDGSPANWTDVDPPDVRRGAPGRGGEGAEQHQWSGGRRGRLASRLRPLACRRRARRRTMLGARTRRAPPTTTRTASRCPPRRPSTSPSATTGNRAPPPPPSPKSRPLALALCFTVRLPCGLARAATTSGSPLPRFGAQAASMAWSWAS